MKLPFLVMLVLSGLVTGLVFSEPTSPPWRFLPAFCLATALGGVGFVAQAREKKRLTWVFSLSMMVLGLLPAASLVLRASLLPERGAQPAEAPVQAVKNDALSRIRQHQYNMGEEKRLSKKLGVQCYERNSWACLATLRTLAGDQELVNQIDALNGDKIEVYITNNQCHTYPPTLPGEIHYGDEGDHSYVRLNMACTREEYRKLLLGTP